VTACKMHVIYVAKLRCEGVYTLDVYVRDCFHPETIFNTLGFSFCACKPSYNNEKVQSVCGQNAISSAEREDGEMRREELVAWCSLESNPSPCAPFALHIINNAFLPRRKRACCLQRRFVSDAHLSAFVGCAFQSLTTAGPMLSKTLLRCDIF
jgi:hypothetical protein